MAEACLRLLGPVDALVLLLSQAERLWRGPVLGDLAGEPFAVAEAARLEELRTVVIEERIEAELAAGRHGAVVAELESLTARYPLRERLWKARMLALYRSGRQADALRAFQDLRAQLAEELGIDPTPELSALEQAILVQSPDLGPPSAGVATHARSAMRTSGECSPTRTWPPPRAAARSQPSPSCSTSSARSRSWSSASWEQSPPGSRVTITVAGRPTYVTRSTERARPALKAEVFGRSDDPDGNSLNNRDFEYTDVTVGDPTYDCLLEEAWPWTSVPRPATECLHLDAGSLLGAGDAARERAGGTGCSDLGAAYRPQVCGRCPSRPAGKARESALAPRWGA